MQYTLHISEGTWYRAGTKLPPAGKPIDKKKIISFDDEVVINTNEPILIGRDETCDVILDSSHVSRKHALIYEDKGHLFIRDTSSYGTTIIRSKENRAGGFSLGGKTVNQISIKNNAEAIELQSEDTLIFGHTDIQLIIYIMG